MVRQRVQRGRLRRMHDRRVAGLRERVLHVVAVQRARHEVGGDVVETAVAQVFGKVARRGAADGTHRGGAHVEQVARVFGGVGDAATGRWRADDPVDRGCSRLARQLRDEGCAGGAAADDEASSLHGRPAQVRSRASTRARCGWMA
jgi:hypothetical protein